MPTTRDPIEEILGFTPPTTGALDQEATHRCTPARAADLPGDSVDDIVITEGYRKALALIDAGAPAIFVTGWAGTGKSTFIRLVRERHGGKVAVVAPTGVAALNAGGATIHSFFRFPPRIINPEDIQRVADTRLYRALKILVIDEISMVRADVIDAIDRFLRLNGPAPSLPFGGIQLLLVGDLAQLPPVVSTEEESALFARRYNSPYFFSAEALSGSVLAPVELDRVFRQTDEIFIDLLGEVRLGQASADTLGALNSRAGNPLPSPPPVVLTPSNAAADKVDQGELGRLQGAGRLFTGEIEGRFKLEDKKLPSPLHLTLKPGARVMFTQNDVERRWVNGTLGVVRELSADRISVEIDERGRGVVDVGRTSWCQFRYRYDSDAERVRAEPVGSFVQFPLQLAWAITIHKAQGRTLPAVHLDLGRGAFAPGQTYVALSRARSLDTVWLRSPIRPSDVFLDERIATFYQGLFGGRVSICNQQGNGTLPTNPE